jgi:hypothetical protein
VTQTQILFAQDQWQCPPLLSAIVALQQRTSVLCTATVTPVYTHHPEPTLQQLRQTQGDAGGCEGRIAMVAVAMAAMTWALQTELF